MNGYIEQIGSNFYIYVNRELVAIQPDQKSAEDCLMNIYLIHHEAKSSRKVEEEN